MAILLSGAAITAMSGRNSFVADVKKNDLWFSPSGFPFDSGLDPDGTGILCCIDD